MLCLAVLLLTACSAEPERPDRRESDARMTVADRTAKEGSATEETRSSRYVEYTVEGVLLRKEEGTLNIEEARLQRTEQGDAPEVIVRATVKAPADYEDCFLMRESTWLDLEQSLENDDVPGKQIFEHPWGRRTLREVFDVGDEVVVIFSESPSTDAEAEDVNGVTLYALCYTEVVSNSAGGQPTTYYDVSHVDETPKPLHEP